LRKGRKEKKPVLEKISDQLEIGADVMLSEPKMSIVSDREIWIENYSGIIEYSKERVRINTKKFIICLYGSNFFINHITKEDIIVCGKILKIELGG